MSGHLLGDLQTAAVLEVSCDAGRSEGVTADPGLSSSSANHAPHIGLEQGTAGQLAAAPFAGAKERAFFVLGDAGGGDVLLQIAVQIVVRGHLAFLATVLVQLHPARPPVHEEILYLH